MENKINSIKEFNKYIYKIIEDYSPTVSQNNLRKQIITLYKV